MALAALMVVGLTLKPVPLTLTLKALLRSLPLTEMVLLTDVPVAPMVPTLTVESLVGDVICGLAVLLAVRLTVTLASLLLIVSVPVALPDVEEV